MLCAEPGIALAPARGGCQKLCCLSVYKMQQVRIRRVNWKEGERGQVQGLFLIVFCSLAVGWVVFPVPLDPVRIIIIIFLYGTPNIFSKPVTKVSP